MSSIVEQILSDKVRIEYTENPDMEMLIRLGSFFRIEVSDRIENLSLIYDRCRTVGVSVVILPEASQRFLRFQKRILREVFYPRDYTLFSILFFKAGINPKKKPNNLAFIFCNTRLH